MYIIKKTLNSNYHENEGRRQREEILTLLDELILQQHLKAMAWEEGRGNKVPSATVWHQP